MDKITTAAVAYINAKTDENFEALLVVMTPTIGFILKNVWVPSLTKEEKMNDIRFAIWKALTYYDPNKSTFRTFAVLSIKSYLYTNARTFNTNRWKTLGHPVSLSYHSEKTDDPESDDEFFPALETEDLQHDRLERLEEYNKDVKRLMDICSEKEKVVLKLYLQGLGYKEMGKKFKRKYKLPEKQLAKLADNALQRIRFKAMLLKDDDDANENNT